jgi:glycosyltransferase involved in cell wall biosynthesis
VFEPCLITLSPEPLKGSAWAEFDGLVVPLHSIGLSRLKGLLLSKRYLRSLVQRIKPDVIHTQGFRADFLGASAFKGYPLLCTSRNDPFADYPTKFGRIRGGLMARQHMDAFRQLNVVACSFAIQSVLKAHGVDADVVQNGVDTRQFQPVDTLKKRALREKLGLPENALTIVSVGSLVPRKDMQTLITAFELASLEEARLVVLGDGPEMAMLTQQAGVSVHMPGNVCNVAEYLGAADLFVSCSLSEGLPNTVLEAMAHGLPCLLSDIPSHRELFEGNKDIFFSCKDVQALVDRFKRVEPARLVEQGGQSRQIVEARFSAEKMSEGYQQSYLRLIGRQIG